MIISSMLWKKAIKLKEEEFSDRKFMIRRIGTDILKIAMALRAEEIKKKKESKNQ